MKIPTRILLILLISSSYWAGQAQCEIEKKEQVNTASAKKETLNFKDPFFPALPKKKIIPKKVEQEISEKPAKIAIGAEEKEIVPPSLSIQGLIWNTNRPQAIVNESVVGIGDTIEGAKIVSIQKTGISIIYQGKPFRIKKDESSSAKSERQSRISNQYGEFPAFTPETPQFPEENTPFDPGG